MLKSVYRKTEMNIYFVLKLQNNKTILVIPLLLQILLINRFLGFGIKINYSKIFDILEGHVWIFSM